jgi:hypothetical protein
LQVVASNVPSPFHDMLKMVLGWVKVCVAIEIVEP